MIEERLYRLARELIAVPVIHPTIASDTLLPHRGQWRLVDNVVGFDRTHRVVAASAGVTPPLDGHFPDAPIYPGVLLVELVNQASLCLLSLLGEASAVRLTRVLGAQFIEVVRPGDRVEVRAGIDTLDSLRARTYGQVVVGKAARATAVVEVMFHA